jgi:hypothetical protein
MKRIILLLLVFTSCNFSEQERNLSSMKEIVNNANQNMDKLNDKQWESIEIKFNELEASYYNKRNSYTEAQKDSINIQIGRFKALQTKRIGKQIKDGFEDMGKQMEGFVNEISK